MSLFTTTARLGPRTFAAVAASTLAATALAVLPASGTGHAYNVGIKSLHFEGLADACLPDQWGCTWNHGEGEANVLRVLQTEVDGYYQFTTLEGTSQLDGHLWLAAEVSAECRAAHHLHGLFFDGDLANPEGDGYLGWDYENAQGMGGSLDSISWPEVVPVSSGDRVLNTTRVALNVPIADALDSDMPLIAGSQIEGGFQATVQGVLDEGEAEIQRRIDEGMTAAEARAIPWEFNTIITVAAEVKCEYDLGNSTYFMRRFASIPLRVEYVPVDVPDPIGELPPPVDDVTDRARVTDAELIVIADPADPCTLHLSGVISTNRETDVEYRFINPYGQPSNTYTVHVDHTLVAMVDDTVEVPHADVVDIDGDLAPTEGHGDVGGLVTDESDTEQYTGTYELEIVSPNHMLAADGFSVDYCEEGDPAFDTPADDVVAEPDPTHSDPPASPATDLATDATTTTVPQSRPPVTTAPTTPTAPPTTAAPTTVPHPATVVLVAPSPTTTTPDHGTAPIGNAVVATTAPTR